MQTSKAIETVRSMNTAQLRKAWTAAVREMGCTTAFALYSIGSREPSDMVVDLILTLEQQKTVSVKTGKRVLWKAYTSGGTDRMVDETVPDRTEASAAIARVLAAAQ